jgi:hypothetical protein
MEDELGYIGSEEMRLLMDARAQAARSHVRSDRWTDYSLIVRR